MSIGHAEAQSIVLRDCHDLDHTRFELSALAGASSPLIVPLQQTGSKAVDGTAALMTA
jgi:hypothetical protein